MTLPAATALAPAAIDRYIAARANGRTDTRPLHKYYTAYYADSVKNKFYI